MSNLTRRVVILGGAALGLTAIGGFIGAKVFLPQQVVDGVYFSPNGVAIRGTDPVAYFTQGEPVQGSDTLSLEWSGTTWHFVSAENRDTFKADPQKYAPQYGGYCAWAVADKGELYSTQPENWSIVDGKLYLNFNDAVQDVWNGDRVGFITKGDKMWPELRAQF